VKHHLETLCLAALIGAILAAFAVSLPDPPQCSTDAECGCTLDCLGDEPEPMVRDSFDPSPYQREA
jgi:hypothetical protein